MAHKIKEIVYGGYSAVPSDYECSDGELAQSENLLQEDGALRPVTPGSVVASGLPEGWSVVFVHETSQIRNYIIDLTSDKKDEAHTFAWVDGKDGALTADNFVEKAKNLPTWDYATLHKVTAIGNTLLFLTDAGMMYFLWKEETHGYKQLGDHIPDIEVQFGLVGHPRLYCNDGETKSSNISSGKDVDNRMMQVAFDNIARDKILEELSDDNKTRVTSQVMAMVNKFIAKETVNNGRFCFPFLLRYALRLYDGTTVNHSTPILMLPSTTAAPVVYWRVMAGEDTFSHVYADVMLVAADIDYRVLMDEAAQKLKDDWGDIVKSIDVFVSKPIYTYDQNGKVSDMANINAFGSQFVGKLYRESGTASTITTDKTLGHVTGDALTHYAEWSYRDIYAMYFADNNVFTRASTPRYAFNMPEYTQEKIADEISSTSAFFYLQKIDLADMGSATTVLKVNKDYLQSLVNRETLKDEYLSHDKIIPSSSFTYNGRLNLSGLQRKLYHGASPYGMFCRCEGQARSTYTTGSDGVVTADTFNRYFMPLYKETEINGAKIVGLYSGGEKTWQGDSSAPSAITLTLSEQFAGKSMKIRTYVRENGREYYVTSRDMSQWGGAICDYFAGSQVREKTWGCYLFYPNTGAYQMEIEQTSASGSTEVYRAKLQEHDFLNGSYAMLGFQAIRTGRAWGGVDSTVLDGSTAYVDIPNKLYTSDVNNPFSFPVTGINTIGTGRILGLASVTKALSEGQFGAFPLYAFTDDGLWAMEVSSTGSYSAKNPVSRDVVTNADSITQIDDAVLFVTARGIMMLQGSQLACITEELSGHDVLPVGRLPLYERLLRLVGLTAEGTDMMEDFNAYLQHCQMIYDYPHQRIIVFSPDSNTAFVFSIKSKKWGVMTSDFKSVVPSYPEALAMTRDGNLVDMSKSPEEQGATPSVIVTRPLKLDERDALKTVFCIIQRGMFRKGHVKQVLYGSRDLFNWVVVGSSNDHYLRLVAGTPYKYFRVALACTLDEDESVTGCTVEYEPRLTDRVR